MKKRLSMLTAFTLLLAIATNAEAPAGYYKKCEGKNKAALLSGLADVVGPHTTISYDGLWDVYETSDVDENGRVWDMYSTKRWVVGKEHCGNYKYVGDCINREHSFPKSWFNDASPMVSDAFHVYPTDGKVNGQRSNYPYGECAGGTTLPSNNGYDALGRLGTSTFPGYSGKVFEPVDEYKGDFARSYFYMATAYNGRISNWNSDMLAHNSYPAFSSWAIELLLKWHRQDPVSEKETARNEAVYMKQKNRNPFIDHPELAEYIWGNKTSQQWYENGTADPELQLPADDTSIDFGLTALNYTISRSLRIQGNNLDKAVMLSVTPATTGFSVNTTSVSAADANRGCNVSVIFCATKPGTSAATLTISCGDLVSNVTLTAEAIDGIPALPASNVTETSFTARWIDLGDSADYQLSVKRDGNLLAGYPVSVYAADEEYVVDGLDENTAYTYQLSDGSKQSNVVSVTTLETTPDIQYIGELSNEAVFSVKPGTPSEATEMWIETDNCYEPLVVSVEKPFELSTDLSGWSQSITIEPEEDRFFVRVGATEEGIYEGFITITCGKYVNEDGHLVASVCEVERSTFTEDFEEASKTNGASGSYNGNIYTASNGIVWTMTDAGIWGEDNHTPGGRYSVRFGKTASSSIETSTIIGGIGTVSFYAAAWSTSEGMTITLQYLKESDNPMAETEAEWEDAGEVVVEKDTMNPYTVTVNSPGNNRLRFKQTSGGRGNIDDIEITPFASSGIDGIIADNDWTAYGIGGEIVIVNGGEERAFLIYDLEGRIIFNGKVNDRASVTAATGFYIVTDDIDARHVVVR